MDIILTVLPFPGQQRVQLTEMTSKVQPWLPSLQIQILTAVFAGGSSLGGCSGCVYVSWSSAAASCLLRLCEDLSSGQRRSKSVDCGFGVTQVCHPPPHPPHHLVGCCRTDCSHRLRCLLWSSSAISVLSGSHFLFLLPKTLPSSQPRSLSFVLAMELGREAGVAVLQSRGFSVECG